MKRRDGVVVLAFAAVAVAVALWLSHTRLAAEVQRHGGVVISEPETPEGPTVSVVFIARPVGDADLRGLRGRRGYERLFLDSTRVTGECLENLGEASDLRWLSLRGCPVTDEGLSHLPALPDLELLNLENTLVTDAGLAHLRRLTGLRQLYLFGTDVSDAGLEHLRGLTRLEGLEVSRTRVTRAGVRRLQAALPGLAKVQAGPFAR